MDALERLIKLIENYTDAWDLCTIAMLGRMRGGKTSLARLVAGELLEQGWEVRYVPHTDPDVIDSVLYPSQRNTLIIFDDMSFAFTNVARPEVARFLKGVSEAAHRLEIHGTERKSVIIFIFHYMKAIPPFLRESYIRILTGPVSVMEAKSLAREKFFSKKALKKYIKFVNLYSHSSEFRESLKEELGTKKIRIALVESARHFPMAYPIVNEPDLSKYSVIEPLQEEDKAQSTNISCTEIQTVIRRLARWWNKLRKEGTLIFGGSGAWIRVNDAKVRIGGAEHIKKILELAT